MTHSWNENLRRDSLRTVALAVLVMSLVFGAAAVTSAAPMEGQTVTIQQPDGTTVDVRVWGDEYYAHGETVDGYSVTRDFDTGYLCFAELSADGNELVSTGVPTGTASDFGPASDFDAASDFGPARAVCATSPVNTVFFDPVTGLARAGSVVPIDSF